MHNVLAILLSMLFIKNASSRGGKTCQAYLKYCPATDSCISTCSQYKGSARPRQYPTVVALPQFCGSESSSSCDSSVSPGNVTIGEVKAPVYEILPALDYIRHTCVSCYDANFQEYCPSDGKCHPSGDCSSCGGGLTAIDDTRHYCMKPSPETCKKDRNMFFCPYDNKCHPQEDQAVLDPSREP